MKHQVHGLHGATPFPEGFFLVRVTCARYRARREKPFLALDLSVIEPAAFAGRRISTRLYCADKALWKLNWFLRDFGYDPELLGRDEIDDKAVVGLRGIVRVLHSRVTGRTFLNLDGFAPAANWDEFRLEKAS
jgi:hypothetical protein